MKSIAQLVLFALVFSVSVDTVHAAEKCKDCGELEIISGQLGLLKPNHKNATTWILAAQNAVRHLSTNANRGLSKSQVEHVTYLLASSKGNDPDFSIIDSNIHLFKANEKAFFSAFAKLEDKSVAEYLKYGLNLKLAELESGKGK